MTTRHETTMQRLLRYNCWLSLWMAMAAAAFEITRMDIGQVIAFPLSGWMIAGALSFIAVGLMTFSFVMRYGGREARWAAGLLGGAFLIVLLIRAAQASLGNTPSASTALVAYVAVAHLAYAFGGSSAKS